MSNLSSVLSVHIIFLNLVVFPYIFQFEMSSLVAGKIVELLGRMTVPLPIHFTKTTVVKPSFIVKSLLPLLISDVFGVWLTRQLQEGDKILSEEFSAV